VVGLLVRVVTGRTFIPYGPYLSLAAIIVLCTWRWLWMNEITDLRYLFGHAPSLATLAAVSVVALVALLGLLRVYQAIPVTRRLSLPAGIESRGYAGDELATYVLPNVDWRCPYSGHRDGP
jgi:leader peptidase (prepilin peptidase)/N-methyltransferase